MAMIFANKFIFSHILQSALWEGGGGQKKSVAYSVLLGVLSFTLLPKNLVSYAQKKIWTS